MLVERLMTRLVHACRADDTLAHAARLMWDSDCGCLPVCGGNGSTNVVGIITDRDICMCGLFEGRPLSDLKVAIAMSRGVLMCRAGDEIENAERIMRDARVRRLPVIDDAGMLVGMLTLADLAREAARERGSPARDVTDGDVEDTLAAICAPIRRDVDSYRPHLPAGGAHGAESQR
jgi:CBS domain-containing protein